MRHVILVHGFWHGSWCWSFVTEQLAARNIPSVAVDLDGHGLKRSTPASHWARPFDPAAFATEVSPVASVTASSAASTLVEQIRRIGGGEPCLVVAHSMGGAVATVAAEMEPSLFAGLTYVTAFAPTTGAAADYISSTENAGEMVVGLLAGDPTHIGAMRFDIGDRDRHAAMRTAFYSDVDGPVADAAISLLSPDGPAGVPGEKISVTAERYGSVPHSYVVCTKDNVIPVALQRRFVREIDDLSAAPTRVVEIDAGHSPFLSQPAALAEAIAPDW